jgi:hypothetical protein
VLGWCVLCEAQASGRLLLSRNWRGKCGSLEWKIRIQHRDAHTQVNAMADSSREESGERSAMVMGTGSDEQDIL